ncbi:PH domain-containing protein [Saccharomonospora cyanea]|uniref:Putative membrane protein n=1 Tax=Saccharomonospora cyanea NA-134 TaxID=882082 RepID=H5XI73_9PSEU|nr:PH domain-containing protein [Saccharomonospora cyanea]EHR60703.1 putative membrane protein [Saccharomonospora cyanea NA-134]
MSGSVAESVPEPEWKRLDRRTVTVTALRSLGVAVAAGVPGSFWLSKVFPLWAVLAIVVAAAIVFVGVGTAVDRVRWSRTRYRVLPDRFELRKGIVVRSRRSLQRDRIRTVDITASPLLRLFRLVHVKVGTGEQTSGDSSSLSLNPVSRADAEWLRTTLLDRAGTREAEATQNGTLSTLDLSWARYAPVSFVTPTLGAAAFGGALQVSEWFGLQSDVVMWAVDLLDEIPLVGAILLLVAVGLVVGVVAATALFVEMWWQYRLEREPGGTLRVRRGLLTTRSISVEERRLRGIELVEPLGNRLAGAARVDAVATGLAQRQQERNADHNTLHPAAPREHVHRIAAAVLREPVSPTEAVRLRAHPKAALGRRIRWALAAVVAVELPLVVLGLTVTSVLLHVAWISAVVLLPVSVALAFAAYRSLGHGITGGYLVTRHGAVRRGTVALRRSGVIGWTIRQSVFQRRSGLLTVTATTAAGSQAYSAYDVGEHEGLAFAEEAVPGLLTPFLERADR